MAVFQAALAAIESGTSQREAVKKFGIPATTLHRHVAVAPLWGQKTSKTMPLHQKSVINKDCTKHVTISNRYWRTTPKCTL